MDPDLPETNALLKGASIGDELARQRLFDRYRSRLRQMVAVRMDRRLLARVDPSDVVQEAYAEAVNNLEKYLRDRPLPFYPWLRQFALQKILQLQRHHIYARCRSVEREDSGQTPPSDLCADALVNLLVASATSPSRRLIREELCNLVQSALQRLNASDRDILLMRHIEEMSTAEIGEVLGINVGAVRARHVRALQRLRGLLNEDYPEAHR
jgi:RNA polymerase sigma-70 factor, ECF subfamily